MATGGTSAFMVVPDCQSYALLWRLWTLDVIQLCNPAVYVLGGIRRHVLCVSYSLCVKAVCVNSTDNRDVFSLLLNPV
jgi:hypothetical protein